MANGQKRIMVRDGLKPRRTDEPVDFSKGFVTVQDFARRVGLAESCVHRIITNKHIREVTGSRRLRLIPRSEENRCLARLTEMRAASVQQQDYLKSRQRGPRTAQPVQATLAPLVDDRIERILQQVRTIVLQNDRIIAILKTEGSHDYRARTEERHANTNGSGEAGDGDSASESAVTQ